MDEDKNWNFSELKASIEKRFGKEHAERALLSIQSVAQRFEHVAYHHSKLIIYNEKVESKSKHELIQKMFNREEKELKEISLKFSAHAIAGSQALHAITDILGSVIYMSLHNCHQWAGSIKQAIKYMPLNIKNLVVELQDHTDYFYLDAVVNQSKHRNIIRSPFLVPISSNFLPHFEFEMFERNAKVYPARDVVFFLNVERTRQFNIVLRIGKELKIIAK